MSDFPLARIFSVLKMTNPNPLHGVYALRAKCFCLIAAWSYVACHCATGVCVCSELAQQIMRKIMTLLFFFLGRRVIMFVGSTDEFHAFGQEEF